MRSTNQPGNRAVYRMWQHGWRWLTAARQATVRVTRRPQQLGLQTLEQRDVPALPALASLATAPVTIYLDFDGHNEDWDGTNENEFNQARVTAFNFEGDATFSATEESFITDVWRQVADKFAPFNVNVTTIEPESLADRVGIRIALGSESNNWYADDFTGVAYVGAFYEANASNTGWVFTNLLYNTNQRANSVLSIANTAAHEAGHTFRLEHLADNNGEYSVGTPAWTPIMGDTANEFDRHTWHDGNRLNNTPQNDVTILANGANTGEGLGFRPDDHGNTLGVMTQFYRAGNTIEAKGIIENWDDVDTFSFQTNGGNLNLTAYVGSRDKDYIAGAANATTLAVPGASLNLILELYDTAGTLLMTVNPTNSFGAQMNANLPAGTYIVQVKSAHQYVGDIGLYRLMGTVPAPTVGGGSPVAQITNVASAPVNQLQQGKLTATVAQPSGADYVVFVRDLNNNGVADGSEPVVQQTDVASSQASATINVAGYSPGTYRYVTRVRLLNNTWGNSMAQSVIVPQPTLRVPTITNFARNPNPVYQGQTLTLTATISDPDSAANSMQFIVDRDGSGTVNTGDTILGNGSSISGGQSSYTLNVSEQYAPGTVRFLVRVRYNTSQWTNATSGAVTVNLPPNSAPAVTSLTPSSTPLVRGLTLTLTANVVAGIQPTTEVNFYFDSNGNGVLDPTTDTVVGHDTTAGNGWTARFGTSGYNLGTNTFFARAEDGFAHSDYVIGKALVILTLPDSTAPQATLVSAPAVDVSGATSYMVAVRYTDDVAISSYYFTEALNRDIRISRLNGNYSVIATFAGVDQPGDGTPRTVYYTITPPGGSWTPDDYGTYNILLNYQTVADTNANYVPDGPLGTFSVTVPDLTPPVVSLSDLATEVTAPTRKNVSSFTVSGSASDAESGINPSDYHFILRAFRNNDWENETDLGSSGASRTLTGLSDGLYSVVLEATNNQGSRGRSESRYFLVDTMAPHVTLTDTPAATINSTTATFAFVGTDLFTTAANLIFEVDLDGSGFSTATSPVTYSNLTHGAHVFRVRAKDETGNVSTPLVYNFTVALVGQVTISDATANENGTLSFTLALSNQFDIPLTINVNYTNVTAIDADYDRAFGTVVFPAYSTTPQTVTVTVVSDNLVEATETFLASLSTPTALGTRSLNLNDTALGTIADDDTVTYTINDVSVSENNTATFTVTPSHMVDTEVTVAIDYQGNGSNPASGSLVDFDSQRDLAVFPANTMIPRQVTIALVNDNLVETLETFSASLSVVSALNGRTVNVADIGLATITDDDTATFTMVDVQVSEGDTATFTVLLSNPLDVSVSLVVNYTNGTAMAADYAPQTATVTFAAYSTTPQTVTVASLQNDIVEAQETFTVALQLLTAINARSVVTSDTALGVINDNDSAIVTIDDVTVNEGDSAVFVLRFSNPIDIDLPLLVEFANATTTDNDYHSSPVNVTYTSGSLDPLTVTVATNADGTDESTEVFTARLRTLLNIGGRSIVLSDTAQAAILDLNEAPTLSTPTMYGITANRSQPIPGLSVNDPEVARLHGEIEVTLTVQQGVLALLSTTGINFTVGQAADAPTMTFRGSLADVNMALATVVYQPRPDTMSDDVLSVSTNDLGSAGVGGPRTTTRTTLLPMPRNVAQRQANLLNPAINDLVIYGTTTSDMIVVTPRRRSYTVTLNDVELGTFAGVSGRLVLFGGAGNDMLIVSNKVGRKAYLDGGQGNDFLAAGRGHDTLSGGSGNDTFQGGRGRDTLYEQADVDFLLTSGSRTSDGTLSGLGFDVIIRKGLEQAHLVGGPSNNTINASAFAGRVTLMGGSGNDVLVGTPFNDVFVGGDGNDVISGDDGRDVLLGGAGLDHLDGGLRDDILVGAASIYDSNTQALGMLLNAWQRSAIRFPTRVLQINGQNTRGVNKNVFLNVTTLIDDAQLDLFTGGLGRDYFLNHPDDRVLDSGVGGTDALAQL